LQQYATALLNTLAFPTWTGSFKVQQPTSSVRAGKWALIFEPQLGALRSLRLARVSVEWQKGDRVIMTCEPTNPLPNIDKAILDSTQGASAGILSLSTRPTLTSLGTQSTLLTGGGIVSLV
jgi:hypothetical protein